MHKSAYHIPKMDCPSEENMIRVKLGDMNNIEQLDFDIQGRKLVVYHNANEKDILQALETLNLGAKLSDSNTVDAPPVANTSNQKKILLQVLAINAGFFVVEMVTGLIYNSMGLVADSLDMLADSFVYLISLLVVGAASQAKKRVATISGYFQIILAIIGVAEVIRRFVGAETYPNFQVMIVVSTLALIGNATCLYLLNQSKSNEAHMRASMIFTSNDVIINTGVILAGVLVYTTKSFLPDLVIGSIVFVIVLIGAKRILSLGK